MSHIATIPTIRAAATGSFRCACCGKTLELDEMCILLRHTHPQEPTCKECCWGCA